MNAWDGRIEWRFSACVSLTDSVGKSVDVMIILNTHVSIIFNNNQSGNCSCGKIYFDHIENYFIQGEFDSDLWLVSACIIIPVSFMC